MCRFVVYKGKAPIRLSDLVTKPIHSITNQTFDSKLRFPSSRPFNADGFGIGYYEPLASGSGSGADGKAGLGLGSGYLGMEGRELEGRDVSVSDDGSSEDGLEYGGAHRPRTMDSFTDPELALSSRAKKDSSVDADTDGEREKVVQIGPQKIRGTTERVRRKLELAVLESERPGLFKSIHPAWSNANLIRLAEKIQSPLVFAHVRASTMPGAPSEDNCHPWTFGKLMWMHNGAICDFHLIKRKLQASLTDELFLFPNGYTDSEWAFALFLSKLSDPHARTFSTAELRKAMLSTLAHINLITSQVTTETGHHFDPHLMNFVVSDGENVVATRYVSSKTDESSSLFFSSGTTFEEYAEGGHYRMTKADKREDIVMIASEPLTFEQKDWMEVKNNTMVVITPKMNVLQIPIMDEFYVPPQQTGGNGRTTDYAIAQGYGHGFMRAPGGAPGGAGGAGGSGGAGGGAVGGAGGGGAGGGMSPVGAVGERGREGIVV